MAMSAQIRLTRTQAKMQKLVEDNRILTRQLRATQRAIAKQGIQVPVAAPRLKPLYAYGLVSNFVSNADGVFTVSQVARETGLSISNIHNNLRYLRNQGIVARTRDYDHFSRHLYSRVSK